jgi:uncharacterized cupredoxin-like copper-binding protein
MRPSTILLATALDALLAACSAGATSSPDAGDAPRTVTATLNDDMRIELSEADFSAGETVIFEVTNEGLARHEFYLGDEEAQMHHAEEMADMGSGMMHDEEDGVTVEPGETKNLEYTFHAAGEMLAGCHEPGHYEAGMSAPMMVAEE